MANQPVLIAGKWRESTATGAFQVENPSTREKLPQQFPVSSWTDCDAALAAADDAARAMRQMPADQIARFLDAYADQLDAAADEICEMAQLETALPVSPRLKDVELPRTTNQLRQAAAAAREESWRLPTIDSAANIRSCYGAIGPVCVFGPNNFPLAFNGVSGGDFAAAIAAGNPVIAKANSSHPATTKLLAEAAAHAAAATELPPGAVQLLYRTSHEDGERMVADPRAASAAYTGSRSAGLKLKTVADAAGKPIYLELSSVNPVFMLPGAVAERGDALVDELAGSCLMAAGQFCTSPNLIVLLEGPETERFIGALASQFESRPAGTLLSGGVLSTLQEVCGKLKDSGAELLAGGTPSDQSGYSFSNTLLRASGDAFLANAEQLQTEAFGNVTTLVTAGNVAQACQVAQAIEGSLTACVYSAEGGDDDAAYDEIAPLLRQRVGRLLNDKMPTGVAVSAAMNHGGPFPATGHPGFTAVGIPASLRRFAMLQCYDNVRPHRLPCCLQNKTPHAETWRLIDGQWKQGDLS